MTTQAFRKICSELDTYKRLSFVTFSPDDIQIAICKSHGIFGSDWNVWTQQFSDDLSEAFKLKHPQFIQCIYPFDTHPVYKKFVLKHFNGEDLVSPQLLREVIDSNRKDMVWFLDKYIRPKTKIYIGNTPETIAGKLIGEVDYYVDIPTRNPYGEIDKWWPRIEKVLKKHKGITTAVVSGGVVSRVTARRLWDLENDLHVFDLDSIMGAMDPDTNGNDPWIAANGYKVRDMISDDPSIEVVTPYKTGGDLGACYNSYMEKAAGWVLFLDHDFTILRPEWHAMCVDAIKRKGFKAGWISAVTNRIYCPDQQRKMPNETDDMIAHIDFSNGLYKQHGNKLIAPEKGVPFSGFFILTHRKAWQDVGGFKNGFLGVDNDYYNKLVDAGYKTWVMPGLYGYHVYDMKKHYNTQAEADSKQTISVCMIVKDEEKNLPRCLESIKGIADEIIVVDTGSTDKTIEIAKSFNAKVYEHPWEDNFSLHRNQSIDYATMDWLFFIDADEELCGQPLELKNWLGRVPSDIAAIGVSMKDIHGGIAKMTFVPTKIFRKGSVRYENIVHNQPQYKGARLICGCIEYKHYGYDLDPERRDAKTKRTVDLLMKRLKTNPKDYDAMFYLVQQHGWLQNWEEMSKYGEIYIANKEKNKKFDYSVYFSLARSYLTNLGKPDDCKRILEMAIKDNPGDIDVLFAMTEYAAMTKNTNLLIDFSNRYLRAYMQFDNERHLYGSRFTHSRTPDSKSFVLINLGATQLQNGMTIINQVAECLKNSPEETKQLAFGNVRRLLNGLGLDLVPKANPPQIDLSGKK